MSYSTHRSHRLMKSRMKVFNQEGRLFIHCWLERVSNCLQSWPENYYRFFIPMTIAEFATSAFFPVTVWTPGGAAIVFPKIGHSGMVIGMKNM